LIEGAGGAWTATFGASMKGTKLSLSLYGIRLRHLEIGAP